MLIDADNFEETMSNRCMYRDGQDCARPVVGCPCHGPRPVDARCSYEACPCLKPYVSEGYDDGNFLVAVKDDTEHATALTHRFLTRRKAEAELVKYPTREVALAAIAAMRS